MRIGIAGSGPAAEAIRAACTDIDTSVAEVDPDALSAFDLGFVVAPSGAEAFDRTAADRWLAVEIGGVGGRPFTDLDASVAAFTPESAGYADLRARVESTTDPTDERPVGDRSAVRLAGATAGRRGVALLSGEDLGGSVVEVPGTERRFLPAPDPAARDRHLRRETEAVTVDDALARAERALDDRVGLVTRVGERESFPVPYYLAATADTTAYADARAAEYAAGVDVDWDAAFMKALGEALERYCAGVYRHSEFTTAPASSLSNAVPPARFVRPEGYRPPDADEALPWVRGEHLESGAAVSLPAEFVHYPAPRERHKPAITTGLGLGNSGAEALLSGLYEVVERDATMLAWYSTFEPLELRIEREADDARPGDGDDPADHATAYGNLVSRARAEGLSVTPLLVTQDVDVPVVAAAVHREGTWPRFAAGSSADLDATAAARGGLAEALQNWMELRAMGPDRAADEGGAVAHHADFPEAVREFVDVDGRVRAADVSPDAVGNELGAAVDRVSAAGLDAYATRLTTPDVAALGFEAVRVAVPEAQPLFTGDPFFGERAERVPPELGFEPRFDRTYHPYP